MLGLAAVILGAVRVTGWVVEESVVASRISPLAGHARSFTLDPPRGLFLGWVSIGDTDANPSFSRLRLSVDGVALPFPHASLSQIEAMGGGRYRHDQNWLVMFSPVGGGEGAVTVRYPLYPRLTLIVLFAVAALVATVPLFASRIRSSVVDWVSRGSWEAPVPGGWGRGRLGLAPVACLGTLVLLLAATAPLGVDLTDEGFSLINSVDPRLQSYNWSAFHWVNYVLLGWLDPPLWGYRLVRLALLLAGGAALAAGFLAWASEWLGVRQPDRRQGWGVGAFIVLCGLLGYSWLPNMISYNDHASFGVATTAGMTLLLMTGWGMERPYRRWLAGALLGAAIVVAMLAKPPTGVLLVLLALAGAGAGGCVHGRLPWAEAAAALVSGGIVAGGGAVLGLDYRAWLDIIPTMSAVIAEQEESVDGIFSYVGRLGLDLGDLFGATLAFAVAGAVLPMALAIQPSRLRIPAWVVPSLLAAGVLAGSIRMHRWPLQALIDLQPGWSGYQASLPWLAIIMMLAAIALVSTARSNRRLRFGGGVVLAVLTGLPFIGSLGTNHSYMDHSISFAAPWAAVIVGLLYLAPRTVLTFGAKQAILVALSVLAVAQIVEGHVFRPFRQPAPLYAMTERLEGIPRGRGLWVDAATRDSLESLRDILTGATTFRPGDPLLPLYDIQGLTYLFHGVSPAYNLYRDTPVRARIACFFLPHVSHDYSRAVMLITGGISDQLGGCLRRAGINYPDDYQIVGTVPFDRKSDVGEFTVAVAVPKSMVRSAPPR